MLLGAFQPPNRHQSFPWTEGTLEGFTAAYGCNRVLYFEGSEGISAAISGFWVEKLRAAWLS
jgi:hypothetical protein